MAKATGRPDLAPPPVDNDPDSIREKVRKQVSSDDDLEELRRELEDITLSPEQQRALDKLAGIGSGVAVLTGEAGTGKTTVVKFLKLARPVAVCAPTGVAAMNVGGPTVDSMFSYDRTTNETRSQKRLDLIMSIVPKVIIIDEASMIGSRMAAYLFKVAKTYGKILILVGDWAQASPVKDGWATESELVLGAELIKLTEVHRQSDEAHLAALNDLRRGEVTPMVRDVFKPCRCSQAPDDDTFLGSLPPVILPRPTTRAASWRSPSRPRCGASTPVTTTTATTTSRTSIRCGMRRWRSVSSRHAWLMAGSSASAPGS